MKKLLSRKDYQLFRLAEMGLLDRVEKLFVKNNKIDGHALDFYTLMHSFVWSSTEEGFKYWDKISSKLNREFDIEVNK